jgi:dUTP pyrophosphatase
MHLYIKPENEEVAEYYKENSGKMTNLHTLTPDAGLDLFCPEDLTIPARSTGKMDTKICCEALRNHNDSPTAKRVSYYLYLRSSTPTKTPLRLANSVGIIDSGYRGNIIACLDNNSDSDFIVKKGTRLVQLCGPMLEPITYDLVECEHKTCECLISSSVRGGGGFGSTGK